MFNSNHDIYEYSQLLADEFREKGYSEVAEALKCALLVGYTAGEQLGELQIVFEKIKDGWGKPTHEQLLKIEEAIEAIGIAFRPGLRKKKV